MKTWRDGARDIIADVVKETDFTKVTEKEFRKKLSDAYPFGERHYHPYKIWCDQVKKTIKTFYHTANKPGEQIGLFK